MFVVTAIVSPRVADAQNLVRPLQVAEATAVAAAASSAPSRLENLQLFVGLDGSKQPQDLGINANMGVRFAANYGQPIIKRAGIGLQIGAAVNLSDAAVHVLDQIEGTSRRSQDFVTVGLFQQTSGRISWAAGYDFLHERYYDTFNMGQVRAQAGVRVSAADEVGAWVTAPVKGQEGVMGDQAVRLDPIGQINGYLSHAWPTGARTTVWAGVATHHHDIVWVFPANLRDTAVAVYGARLELPLNDRMAVTGSGNFLTPTATGTVDAYLGVTFYPGRPHQAVARSRFQAPMAVGNNPEFPVDLRR
jgi:hypothetical protein